MRNARSTKNDYTRIKLKKLVKELPLDATFDSRDVACLLSTPHRNVKPRTIGNLLREIDNVVLIDVSCVWRKIKMESGETGNV